MTLAWLVLLPLVAPARAGTVEMDGSTFEKLTTVPEPKPPARPGPYAASREVTLVPVEGGLVVRATWTLRTAKPGWFRGVLIGPGAHVGQATWNGGPAALATTPDGAVLTGWVDGPVTVVLRAFVPAQQLTLLPAVEGRVHLQGDLALAVDGTPALTDGTEWVTGAAHLARVPPPPAPDSGRLVLARDALGLTVGDAEVTGHAHLVWVVRRGKLDAVAVRVGDVGADLAVDGANVASWTRTGDRVDVALREPATDRVDLDLRWSTPTPAGTEAKLPLPHVEPLDAFRTEATVQIGHEEGLEVVPDLAGWTPISSTAVPAWGRGLVQGAPSASFHAERVPGGRLDLLRFVPVDLPPAVIDVADYRVTTTAEGRLLSRAFFEVRNERAPWLRVAPPPGWHIVGARVQGETARLVTDGKPGWLVPLPRSVPTVEGLLSFTVEVTFLGERNPWARGTRALPLPVVDADVADWRVTVFLPPGWEGRNPAGHNGVVEQFAQGKGLSYGLGVGNVGSAEADETFQDAVSAWLSNDFQRAQDKLDTLRASGVKGQNIDFLQSNLDLVSGKRKSTDYNARQVRAQAQARAQGQVITQKELAKKGEKSMQAGDLEAAGTYYSKAIEIGNTLSALEPEETVEAKERNTRYKAELKKVQQDEAQRKVALGNEENTQLPWNVKGPVDWNVEGKPDWSKNGKPDWDTSGRPAWEPPEKPATGEAPAQGEGAGSGAAAPAPQGRPAKMTSAPAAPGTAAGGYTVDGEMLDMPVEEDIEVTRRLPHISLRTHGRRGRGSGRTGSAEVGVLGGVAATAEKPLPTPEVHASALSVVVPAIGQRVRFQRHLVPAGAAEQVALSAHPTKRSTP